MFSIYVAESNFFNRHIHIEGTTSCVSISRTQTARVRPGKATHGRKGSKRKAIASNITLKLHQINKDRVWVGIEPLAMSPLQEKDKTYYRLHL